MKQNFCNANELPRVRLQSITRIQNIFPVPDIFMFVYGITVKLELNTAEQTTYSIRRLNQICLRFW